MKLNTEEQQAEFDKNLIEFAKGSGSCDEVCAASGGRVCARDWFLFVDVCHVAQKAFPNMRCAEVTLAAVPTGVSTRAELLVSRDTKADPPTCEAKPMAGGERLCPCVARERARHKALANGGEKVVADIVTKVLHDLDAQERIEVSRAQLQQTNHQVPLDEDGTQVSTRMYNDLLGARVAFFKSKVQETCEQTCREQALKCAPRWFKTLNRCEVLMGAFPQSPDGQYFKECGSQFYGHDLPGYQAEMKQLLLNNDLDNFPTTCGGRGDYTQRLCPCAYKYPNTRVTYHTVFNVQVSFIHMRPTITYKRDQLTHA
jgi:hypothetical protein